LELAYGLGTWFLAASDVGSGGSVAGTGGIASYGNSTLGYSFFALMAPFEECLLLNSDEVESKRGREFGEVTVRREHLAKGGA
jgi:hypothetical protein